MQSLRRATGQCETARQLPFIQGSAPANEPACGNTFMDKVRDIFQ